MLGRIVAVNVAHPSTVRVRDRDVETGIDKRPVEGVVAVEAMGLAGDRRVEKRKFGELNHAVHIYPHEHYAHWQRVLEVEPFSLGHFGENLTATGVTETAVRMGDVLRAGTCRLQVTSPRIPCAKLNARMGRPFTKRFLQSRRTGYYLRVLEPGRVAAGDSVERVDSDGRSPTVDEFTRVALVDYWDAEGLAGLLASRDLIDEWRRRLEDKLARARNAEGWFGFRDLEVVAKQSHSPDLVSLSLRCPYHRSLTSFAGGQHVTVAWRPDADHSELRRAYALTGDPARTDELRITVLRRRSPGAQAPDGQVSSYLCDGADVGHRLRVAAPRGDLTLHGLPEGCATLVVLTKGIGLASARGLLGEWARLRRPARLILAHDGDEATAPLLAEVEAIAAKHPLTIVAHDQVEPSVLADRRTQIFVFGRGDFVDAQREGLRGVAARPVRWESFGR